MSVPVRSATELAADVREAMDAGGDFQYEPVGVTGHAALAALVALAERAERERDEALDIPGAELGWDGATTALQRAEARVAELETALREIATWRDTERLQNQAELLRHIARAALAAGSPTGQEPEVCDDCRGTGQHVQHGGAWTCRTCKGTGLSPTGQPEGPR